MVRKDSQFKVKIVVFTAVLRFISIELSQVSQLLTIGLYLGGLQIYNLQVYSLQISGLQIYSLQIYNLNSGRGLVRILVYRVRNLGYRGIAVRNLSTRYTLAHKINSKTTQVCRINLVKRVRYKASNYIKFRASKEFLSNVILVQDFFLSLLYLVFLIQYIIQRLYNSNSFVFFNLYALVTEEGLQITESYKFIGLKDGFRKVYKIFLILFLYVVIYKVLQSEYKR